jgi:putative ABC transport system substrate-binding protein
MLFALCSSAEGQQPKKMFRIGFISPASSSTAGPNLEALQHGLRDLGYVVGTNITLEIRWAEGSAERLSHLIAELEQLKVDVIVVGSAAGALAAKRSQTKIPVVFAAVTDPLGHGIIDSLARPGSNLTGVSLAVGEAFSGKWIELLHEAVPKVTRMALLRNPQHPLGNVFHSETQAAARALGVGLVFFEAQDPVQVTSALARIEKEPFGAFVLTPDPLFSSQRNRIVKAVARRRLPSMFFSKEFTDAGGLMSYGPSFPDSYRRAAVYVDKILKGTKPADIPVEQPTKFEFVVNLKAAKQIGVTIPQSMLYRVDKVIR